MADKLVWRPGANAGRPFAGRNTFAVVDDHGEVIAKHPELIGCLERYAAHAEAAELVIAEFGNEEPAEQE